uniref:O-antigen ligase family protein n=1 Tax=Aromatoleum sp. TaxID=2307007 RepID=UPI002FCC5494
SQRDALQDGIVTALAREQGTELLWLVVIVCAGVALLQVAMGLAARHLERPALLAPGRRAFAVRALAVLAVVCAVGVATGAPGWANDQWQEFKAPVGAVAGGGPDNVFSRLSGVSGNGRYQYWQTALDANETAPWKGIGPGTFEFWWARHGTDPGFIRDAHTLYFETLAETGIVGLALLGGLLAFLPATAIARSRRAALELRIAIAAAVGGLAAFLASAAFEWVWEMAAIACVVMALGAVIVAGRAPDEVGEAEPTAPRWPLLLPRTLLAVLAAVALGVIAVPMAGALATRDSRDAAAEGKLVAALQDARTAQRLQPAAATPHLQQALVLEEAGALKDATMAARVATTEEPTNWRTWFVLARIEARRGQAAAALAALRKARSLNPRSPFLARR